MSKKQAQYDPEAPTVEQIQATFRLAHAPGSLTLVFPSFDGPWFDPPRDELKRRLNDQLQGRDPGEPIHWRGLK